jgi:integrase
VTATLAPGRRTAYPLDPLRETRHLGSAAAREFADWLSWLEVSNKAPRTLDNYKRTIAALLIAFPDKVLACRADDDPPCECLTRCAGPFTDGDLLQLLALYPKKSRHLNRSHLSSFFGWARKTRRIDDNPVDMLPDIKYRPTRVYDTFSEAESDALCGLPAPDGQLMTLLLWAGLRRSEARHLTGKRLDFQRRQIILIDGVKGGKTGTVPMIDRVQTAAAELVTLEGIGRNDYLWYDRPGGHAIRHDRLIGHSTFGRWWDRCVTAAGVPYRKPHMTRHSFASALYAMGMSDKEVQVLLRHESSRTTMDTYVHVRDEDVAARFRALVGDRS